VDLDAADREQSVADGAAAVGLRVDDDAGDVHAGGTVDPEYITRMMELRRAR
jgi:hypothetical protein